MQGFVRIWVLVGTFWLVGFGTAFAQESKESADKTLAPYFFVPDGDPKTDKLPLKSTSAEINIVGVIADVKITQVYKNEGKRTLEAIYIFPMSTRAAVYAMQMTIGTRVIKAKIEERKKARQEYEKAKQEGKTASLLEQQRPNVFQMNVANILPGDELKVELWYTELLVPEEGVYEFVFPTVVGPRYSNKPAEGAAPEDKWVENPYLHQGEESPFTFELTCRLNSGVPIAKVYTPSHETKIEFTGKHSAYLHIPPSRTAGKKDFVLRYQLAGKRIETGLLLYSGKEENFFLLMVEPPKRITPSQIPPREYLFILDVSGSMFGFPLEVSKALITDIISSLRPQDYFNVLLFAGGNAVLSQKPLPATEPNKQKAIAWFRAQRGGGGTELLPALKRALSLPKQEGLARIVVVATDGYVDVEREAFDIVRNRRGGANFFVFGIGTSVNRYLIEGLARAGKGVPFVAINESEAHKQAQRFKEYVQSPVLTDIKVEYKGFEAYEQIPSALPDLFAERPVVLVGKFRGSAKGEITVRGRTPAGEFLKRIDVRKGVSSANNRALRLLWARHKVMDLVDYVNLRGLSTDERKALEAQIVSLGLKYSIMTRYTSFVAIDQRKRADGKLVTVKQPLPLPEGVSDYAVGGTRTARALGMGIQAEGMSGGVAKPIIKGKKRPCFVRVWVQSKTGAKVEPILKVLKKNVASFEKCCSMLFKKDPNLEGSILVHLSIEPDGRVGAVKVELYLKGKLQKQLERCVITKLRRLQFPKQPAKTEFDVYIDFLR